MSFRSPGAANIHRGNNLFLGDVGFVAPVLSADARWDATRNTVAGGDFVLTNNNTLATRVLSGANPGNFVACLSVGHMPASSGKKFYGEVVGSNYGGFPGFPSIGICNFDTTTAVISRSDGNAVDVMCSGGSWINGVSGPGSPAFGENVVVMVAYDSVTRQVWFGAGGTWFSGNPAAGTGEFAVAASFPNGYCFATFNAVTNNEPNQGNFSVTNWAFAPPAGFVGF